LQLWKVYTVFFRLRSQFIRPPGSLGEVSWQVW
jgi:hypothetical protein